MPTRFDQVLQTVRTWASAQASPTLERPPQCGQSGRASVVFVRDLRGRIRVVVDWTSKTAKPLIASGKQPDWASLHNALGAFSPGLESLVCYRDGLQVPGDVFDNKELRRLNPGGADSLFVLERQLVGADWLHKAPTVPEDENFKRITFFGLKGGVGRSTALSILALHLADMGKKVLVIDLDLESPGIGSMLLQISDFPQFGGVDWFVEDSVGQADSTLLSGMVANGVAGVRVVPAFGSSTDGYLSMLSRAYIDGQRPQFETFTQRLRRFIESLEAQEKPDFTLIDSRGGIHDLAATAVTQLGALALLFASDSRQTWDAYKLLFSHWTSHPEAIQTFRENLKMVHALSPGRVGASAASDKLMQQQAHQLFVNTVYDNVPAGGEGFSFSTDDSDGPHFPLPIRWSELAQGLDPAASPEMARQPQVAVLFQDFIKGVTSLLGL